MVLRPGGASGADRLRGDAPRVSAAPRARAGDGVRSVPGYSARGPEIPGGRRVPDQDQGGGHVRHPPASPPQQPGRELRRDRRDPGCRDGTGVRGESGRRATRFTRGRPAARRPVRRPHRGGRAGPHGGPAAGRLLPGHDAEGRGGRPVRSRRTALGPVDLRIPGAGPGDRRPPRCGELPADNGRSDRGRGAPSHQGSATPGRPVLLSDEYHLADAFEFSVVRRGPGRRFS